MGSTFLADALRMLRSKATIILCGLISTALTARFLGPDGSGEYAALVVYPGLLMSLGAMGVRQSAGFLLGTAAASEKELRHAILSMWMVTSLIGVISSYLLIRNVSTFHGELESILAVLAIPFSLYASYISGIYLGRNEIKELNRVDWIPAVATLLGNILFVALLSWGVPGALLAGILGPIVIFLIVLYRNPISWDDYTFNYIVISKLVKMGAVYAISMLVINLNYRFDLILLDKLSTASALGIYSKGAAITQYLWQIPMLLGTIVFARSATAPDPREYSLKVARLLRVSIVVVGLGCATLYLLCDYIVIVLYGPDFATSGPVIRILLPGVFIMTIFKVMNMDLAGRGKPWVAIIVMVPSLLINILANLYLIPTMGALGAAWASALSYSFAGLALLAAYCKVTELSLAQVLMFRRDDFEFVAKRLRRK